MKTIQLPIRGLSSVLNETAPELMKLRPSVLFYPVYKKKNSKGLSPIYCRITYAGQRAEFSTGLTIRDEDFKNGELQKTAQGYETKSAELMLTENEIQQIFLSLRFNKEYITAHKIKRLYLTPQKPVPPFFSLLKEYTEDKICQLIAGNTIRTYRNRLNTLRKFFTEKNILHLSTNELTNGLVADFETWMLKQKHSFVYINRHIQLINKVVQKAIGNGFITHNICSGYEFKQDGVKCIVSLTKKELQIIEKKIFSEKLQRVADLYIFCCYTSFAYCDLVSFNYHEHVQVINGKKWIIKSRQKSHVEQITPLFKKAEEILKKYDYQLPKISQQKFNDYLKLLAESVGIQKQITTHTARKTFAMIRIEDGYTFDVTAKMMGHTSSKQTENTYGKVTYKRIALEMKNKNSVHKKVA